MTVCLCLWIPLNKSHVCEGTIYHVKGHMGDKSHEKQAAQKSTQRNRNQRATPVLC
jgi:hypothetical protein